MMLSLRLGRYGLALIATRRPFRFVLARSVLSPPTRPKGWRAWPIPRVYLHRWANGG